MRVGFIGLGNIGAPMAERLLQGGLEVVVFDTRAAASDSLVAQGARAASSAGELAAAVDMAGVCVRDDDDVRAVMLADDGVLAQAVPGAVFALHSTILPRTVLAVGAVAAKRGIGIIDAPITGGAAGARSGQLTYMVGGDAALIERCRPVFELSAARIVSTGPLGSGAAMKLCNNLMTYLGFLSAFEAMLLAQGAGLSFDKLQEVTRLNGNLTEQMLAFVGARRLADEQPENDSLQMRLRAYTDLGEKDLAVTLAYARECGVSLPATALCQQLMARVFGIQDKKRR